MRCSYLGGHARVEGILILCRAHLLPPHHLLQTHVIIILEVAHTLAINMSLNLRTEGRWRNAGGKKQGELNVVNRKIHWKLDAVCKKRHNLKMYSNHI